MAKNFCPECGERHEPSAQFCKSCGHPFAEPGDGREGGAGAQPSPSASPDPELAAEVEAALDSSEGSEPPEPSGWRKWGVRIAAVAVVVGLGFVVLTLLTDEVIDSADVEAKIGAELERRGIPVPVVFCPDDVKFEAPKSFECTAVPGPNDILPKNIDEITIRVTLLDEDGSYEFVVPRRQFTQRGS